MKPVAPINRFTLSVAEVLEPEDLADYLLSRGWKIGSATDGMTGYSRTAMNEEILVPTVRQSSRYGVITLGVLSLIAMDEGRDVSYDLALFQFAAEIAGARGRVGNVYRVLTDFLHGPVGIKSGAASGSASSVAAIA